jgi:hypothetical protein
MYPDDCLQSIISPTDWWIKNEERELCRGALLISLLPHFDQIPYGFEPIGRTNSEQHVSANIKVAPLKVNQPLKQTSLPVAAMPLFGNEVWAAYRAKRRPCLVIGSKSVSVDKTLTRGKPKSATAPTVLVAPYYGVDENGKRAGYHPEFIERVRHCEYPQFVWDHLPIKGNTNESILRLDQLQPIGSHYDSFKILDYKLSDDALGIIDELIGLLVWGGVREDSLIKLYREEIEQIFC